MSSTESASACGNTWPYSTAGRARSSGARGHRTPGRSGRPSRRWPDGKPPAATVRNSGSLRLEFEGVSLYRGYDLRSLMPEAVTLQYEPPLFDAPTSAREAAVELARQYAGLQGASVAVRCDRNGTLMAADEAALFAIRGKRVYVPPGETTAERSLALGSIRAAGLELIEAPVGRDELPRMDELFFIDHRGVTALSRCDGQPYMAILAERIAGALRGLFPKM